jgi:hypothetical protein
MEELERERLLSQQRLDEALANNGLGKVGEGRRILEQQQQNQSFLHAGPLLQPLSGQQQQQVNHPQQPQQLQQPQLQQYQQQPVQPQLDIQTLYQLMLQNFAQLNSKLDGLNRKASPCA